jgi:DNA (cytosine-5)-methyltransferase 1
MNQNRFTFQHELIVDLFAGGGGASLGIEQAFGRPVDICVNHDADAVAMHAANHPGTEHLRCDVFEVDPIKATGGRQIGLLWASPDCKHFSKAKGGKPRSKKIRSLAWVVVKWADVVRPRMIMLENVEEFVTWGPLGKNGQPCPNRKGATFNRWVAKLRKLGYKVEWNNLRACDYGAPTIRNRFFLIARCDGLPITWPTPTHRKPDSVAVKSGKLLPWRTAAECIDFTLPTPSIFLSKDEARALGVKRPLAEATMKRIAKGIDRFVLNAAKPFIVPIQNYGWGDRCASVDDPMRTVTAGPKGGAFALAAPTLIQTGYGEREGQAPRAPGLDVPLGTVVAGGCKHALVAAAIDRQFGKSMGNAADAPLGATTAGGQGKSALVSAFLTKYRPDSAGADAQAPFPTITANGESDRPGGNPPLAVIAVHLDQANAGFYDGAGRTVDAPAATVCAQGSMQRLVSSTLVKLRGTSNTADIETPLHTVSAQGFHHAEVRAFLIKFYSEGGQHAACGDPMHTVPTRDRMGLVTVDGSDYAIADIGLRMLTPRELFRAQGFPESYIIDRGVGGRKLPKDAQVRMCGNSVCPPLARALVAANVGEVERAWTEQAA